MLLKRLRPLIGALVIQLSVLGGLAVMASWLPHWVAPPYPLWGWVLAQSVLAVLVSWWWLPPWWRIIQGILPWLLAGMLWLRIDWVWSGIAALLLWLVFRHAVRTGVPLYLSGRAVPRALCVVARTLKAPVRFMDLGCGIGTVLIGMVRCKAPIVRIVGVETAPLSWGWARLRLWRQPADVYGMDLWSVDLSRFNLVYAFLSPLPMARLEQKIMREMPPDSIFVSNSFPLPAQAPTEVWQLKDRRGTLLYLYRFDREGQLIPPVSEAQGAEEESPWQAG